MTRDVATATANVAAAAERRAQAVRRRRWLGAFLRGAAPFAVLLTLWYAITARTRARLSPK